jgi:3-hydroxy-9,10-secoandrosta-1,3,5(10)-triene-9,17-dione monooxygenase reductase component
MTADLRAMMRLWVSGVTVVTAAHEGQRFGTTANSFTSVSLEPPTVLICLHKNSETTQIIQQSGQFAISLLAQGHEDLSQQFAGFKPLPDGADRFYGVETHKADGLPILTDAIAWLTCKLTALHEGHSHWIVVGEVIQTGRIADENARPLAYFNRAYRHISE